MRILFLSTLLGIVYFSALLLPMIFSVRSDALPLEHAAVPASGAGFLIVILVVDDIDDVPALVDIQGVVSSVLLVLDSSRPLLDVALARRQLVNYLLVVEEGDI